MKDVILKIPANSKKYCIVCGSSVTTGNGGRTKKGKYIQQELILRIWREQQVLVTSGETKACPKV